VDLWPFRRRQLQIAMKTTVLQQSPWTHVQSFYNIYSFIQILIFEIIVFLEIPYARYLDLIIYLKRRGGIYKLCFFFKRELRLIVKAMI